MYQRILVATDFSTSSDAAARQADWLAGRAGCPILLVHVIPDLAKIRARISYDSGHGLAVEDLQRLAERLQKDADLRLRKLAADLGAGRGKLTRQVLAGTPVVEVVRAARQQECDLVMTGRRGLSRARHFLLGSTARRLVRKCPAAVWVVKQPVRIPPKSILAAVDFSDTSAQAVRHAAWLAQQAAAELHLLHVIDSSDVPADLYTKMTAGKSRLTARQRIRRAAREQFDAFLRQAVPAGMPVVPHLSWGTPWQEIARVARQASAGLVVLGTVGRSGIQGILLGNTAERVLDHVETSVLTVKPPGFVSPL